MASVVISTARLSSSSGIVAALNAEWGRLDADHAAAVLTWVRRHEVFLGCRSLQQVLEVVRSRASADTALHALLVETANGEQLAAESSASFK